MPSQDAKRAPEEAGERRLSRRSLLQGAATAGAAGLAATAIGAAGPALAATSSPRAAERSSGRPPGREPAGPIMVHVRDTRSGDIEVFAGTSQTRLRDKDLAARIARAIG
jgi:nitrous oxide reductase